MSKSRGHVRHEEHEEHEEHINHEAWVIPYADLLTLLMALFLVLFAVGRTDLEKFKKMAQSFKQEFGNSATSQVVSLGGSGDNPTGDGGSGILAADLTPQQPAAITTTTTSPADQALEEKNAAIQAAQTEANSLQGVEDSVRSVADAFGVGGQLNFTIDARGLVVTIVTDQVLFQPGDADLQAEGLTVLDVVAQALANVPNDVSVEGHTDDRPISNSRYASNWELSNARATSVLRYLIEHDQIPASRLSAVGYADQRPIADNSTIEGAAKNRRVEIVVKAAVSLDPVLGAPGAPGAPAADAPAGVVASAGVAGEATATATTVAGAGAGGVAGTPPNVVPNVVPNLEPLGPTTTQTASEGPAPVADIEAITGTSFPSADPNVIPDMGPNVDPTRAPGTASAASGQ